MSDIGDSVKEVRINKRERLLKPKKAFKTTTEEEKLYSCLYISDEGISKLNSNLRTLPSLTFKNKFMQSSPKKKTKNNGLEESFLSSNSDSEEESSYNVESESLVECSSSRGRVRFGSVYRKFAEDNESDYYQEPNSEVNKCTVKTIVGSQRTKKSHAHSGLFLKQNSYDKNKIDISHRENRFFDRRKIIGSSR